jgi:hypothetical protein
MNRHEVEDERALQERSSEPLGLESCAATARDPAKRRWRIGGVAIEPRKDTTRTPTRLTCAEGNMDRSGSASFCSGEVEDPTARQKLQAREPGDLGDACCLSWQ